MRLATRVSCDLRVKLSIPILALLWGCSGGDANERFLAENAAREGVQTTESGLQYEVLRDGSGPKPSVADTVTVHYHGTLIDGTVFDSSVERNQPATFPLMQVVPGWKQGIPLMPVGSKYKLYIPPHLGYGSQAKGNIPPGSVLIFEVELLGIEGR